MVKDPWHRNHLIRDAIVAATYSAMKEDPSIFLMGEGAVMKVHFDAPQIEREFPDRVITLPISEDANTNFAVGMTLAGAKVIVDVITSDFLYRTMDSICNTAAKQATVRSVPSTIVIRSEFMTGGPTTGQRIESLFCHIPGLNVVVPSNPADAYVLMATALKTPGVTLFFEDRMIEDAGTEERDGQSYRGTIIDSFGKARRRQAAGSDLTVVSYGLTLRLLDTWLKDEPYELFDLRTLYPLDIETILDSVGRTGALLVIEPDVQHGGIGAEIVAQVVEWSPGVRVERLGAPRCTIPASRDLHEHLLPTRERVLAVARELAR
jgi:acetoin:2,6-dichlorophenolindophenol oxidoreductase subunit beta